MVYKGLDRFDQGPSGLYDREREGRPKKIPEEVEAEIEVLLDGNPTEEGENATRPATDRIAEHLEKARCQRPSSGAPRRTFSLRYSWTPPRRKLQPVDPGTYQERIQTVVEAVGEVGPDATVPVEDETEVKRFPPLRRQWQPIGEQQPAGVPDGNEDFVL